MTREEIIDLTLRGVPLKQEPTPGRGLHLSQRFKDWLFIKESEEAKDLIDRAECLKRIEEKTMEPSIQANKDTANGLGGAWQIVYSMPKAKLEIPTARWAIVSDEQGEIIVCGNCGRVFPTMEPYCGNCGRRMLKPVKEEET